MPPCARPPPARKRLSALLKPPSLGRRCSSRLKLEPEPEPDPTLGRSGVPSAASCVRKASSASGGGDAGGGRRAAGGGVWCSSSKMIRLADDGERGEWPSLIRQRASAAATAAAVFVLRIWQTPAKANSVLAKVRGKDFRHEKTKRKRGTYRGGATFRYVEWGRRSGVLQLYATRRQHAESV